METDVSYITAHYKVHGMVQGVGFRYWTMTMAQMLLLGGFVRNLPDGSVEVVVTGQEQDVQRMEDLLRSGPTHGFVKELQIIEKAISHRDYGDFTILR